MAIDVFHETIVSINKSRSFVPGRRPNLSTVYRWMNRADAPLETVLIGGRRYTSKEAIQRFIAGCNAPGMVEAPTDAKREQQITDAVDDLAAELA